MNQLAYFPINNLSTLIRNGIKIKNIRRKSTQQKKIASCEYQENRRTRWREASKEKIVWKKMEESVQYHLWSAFLFSFALFHPRDYKYLILLLHYLPILFFEAFICWVFPLRTIFHLNTCVCCCGFIRDSIRSGQNGKELFLVCELIFFLTLCCIPFLWLAAVCCKVRIVVGSRHHKYRQYSERDFISDWKIHSIRIICKRIRGVCQLFIEISRLFYSELQQSERNWIAMESTENSSISWTFEDWIFFQKASIKARQV